MVERNQDNASARAGVALLHGLGRSPGSMWVLARRLEAHGFRTTSIGYASRRLTIDQAVRRVSLRLRERAADWPVIHLVGHSLGGIVAARIAERASDLPIGRVVQIGSPNSGSRVARLIGQTTVGERIFGPALAEIARLQPPRERRARVGAIAGELPLNSPGEAVGLEGPNDLLVEVDSALSGAGHTLVLPALHGLLPLSADVSRQVIRFLEDGRFEETTP